MSLKLVICSGDEILQHFDVSINLATRICMERMYRLLKMRYCIFPGISISKERLETKRKIINFAHVVARRSDVSFEFPDGILERELAGLARGLLDSLKSICNIITKSPKVKRYLDDIPGELGKTFLSSFDTYVRRYESWNIPFRKRSISRIKQTLVLYHLEMPNLIEDGEGAEAQVKIENLRMRMGNLGADFSLADFDEFLDDLNVELESSFHHTRKNGLNYFMRHLPSEQGLVHECSLDPLYRLKQCRIYDSDRLCCGWEKWSTWFLDEIVVDLLQKEPNYLNVFDFLNDIKEEMCHMWDDSPVLKQQANCIIDTGIIKQRLDSKCYSWEDFIALFHSIIGMLDTSPLISITNCGDHATAVSSLDKDTKEEWLHMKENMESAEERDKAFLLSRALDFAKVCVRELFVKKSNQRSVSSIFTAIVSSSN